MQIMNEEGKRVTTILCDMDGIIVDLMASWLHRLSEAHGIKANVHQIDRWDLHTCEPFAGVDPTIVYAPLNQRGTFADALPIPGALESLRRLRGDGYELAILSSAEGQYAALEKREWLAKFAPFIPKSNIMFVSAPLKRRVFGNYLIDDHPNTLVDHAAFWRDYDSRSLGVRYPYNAHVQAPGVHIFHDYRDTVFAWNEIVNFIEEREGVTP